MNFLSFFIIRFWNLDLVNLLVLSKIIFCSLHWKMLTLKSKKGLSTWQNLYLIKHFRFGKHLSKSAAISIFSKLQFPPSCMYRKIIFKATAVCKFNDTRVINDSRHKSNNYLTDQINFWGLFTLLPKIPLPHEEISQNNNNNNNNNRNKKANFNYKSYS